MSSESLSLWCSSAPSGVGKSVSQLKHLLSHDAPGEFQSLYEGAPPADLVRMEEMLEQRLPDDLAVAWMLHNGQSSDSGLLDGSRWFDTATSLNAWRANHLRLPGWKIGWLPIAGKEGQQLFVVLSDPARNRGSVWTYGTEDSRVRPLADSFQQLLDGVAQQFASGRFGYFPGLGVAEEWCGLAPSSGVVSEALNIGPELAGDLISALGMGAEETLVEDGQLYWPNMGIFRDYGDAVILDERCRPGDTAWMSRAIAHFGLPDETTRVAAEVTGRWCMGWLNRVGWPLLGRDPVRIPRFGGLELRLGRAYLV